MHENSHCSIAHVCLNFLLSTYYGASQCMALSWVDETSGYKGSFSPLPSLGWRVAESFIHSGSFFHSLIHSLVHSLHK